MTAKRGSELVLLRGQGDGPPETFEAVTALRNVSVQIGGETIDTTTGDDKDVNDVIWRTRISGPKEFTVSGDAIGKDSNKTLVQAIYDDFATDTATNYQVVAPFFGTWEAPMLITGLPLEGPFDDVFSFRMELTATAAPTFTPEA